MEISCTTGDIKVSGHAARWKIIKSSRKKKIKKKRKLMKSKGHNVELHAQLQWFYKIYIYIFFLYLEDKFVGGTIESKG